MPFDLVLPRRDARRRVGRSRAPADVGVRGDRIAAIGDLSAVADGDVASVIDVRGLVVAPGFVDPHGHSDGTLFVDGALASHLHQGYTTQLSGNCGYTFAPLDAASRGRASRRTSRRSGSTRAGRRSPATSTRSTGSRSDQRRVPRRPRDGARGRPRAGDRAPDAAELAAMVRHVDEALDAGAVGVSSGLIYAPGIHGPRTRWRRSSPPRAGAAACTRPTCATSRTASTGRSTRRSRPRAAGERPAAGPAPGLAPQGRREGGLGRRARALVERLERARAAGHDVAADQYPYTAASTTLATILPPAILALEPEDAVAALRDPARRARIRDLQASGISGWENVAQDPGWDGIVIARATSRPEWNGRSLAAIAEQLGGDPFDLALDVLADDRLDVDIVLHCMDEADLEAIMRVPWIAVCTDAGGRRPGHAILDDGVPAPARLRLDGPGARPVRARARRPAARDRGREAERGAGGADRPDAIAGQVREGWAADLVVFDPATVLDEATYERPARYPTGIPHVVVNGAARDPRRHRDRRAAGPAPAAGRVTRAAGRCRRSSRPSSSRGCPGGDLEYTLRRSPRARRLRVTIHPERGVVVIAARRRAARLGPPGRARRPVPGRARGLDPRPSRPPGGDPRATRRPAPVDDGRLVPFLGETHRIRVVDAPAGLRGIARLTRRRR